MRVGCRYLYPFLFVERRTLVHAGEFGYWSFDPESDACPPSRREGLEAQGGVNEGECVRACVAGAAVGEAEMVEAVGMQAVGAAGRLGG